MTQEEKIDLNQKVLSEEDNTILQNELLSKLIKTPPNLSLKYENEELNKFKDEILLYLNERNNHFLTLIKYFQDKMNQTREEKIDLIKEIEKLNIELKNQPLTPPPEMVRERELLLREKDILIAEKDKLISEKEHFEALLNDNKKGKEEALQQLEESTKKNTELTEENNTLK